MLKLDLFELRQRVLEDVDSAKDSMRLRNSLIERIRTAAFEISPDGIVALVTFAHLSRLTNGALDAINLGECSKFKGENVICKRGMNGSSSAHSAMVPRPITLHPEDLVDAILIATHMPLTQLAREEILKIINPLETRDFDHFSKVLDLIPAHTLSAMMTNGPLLSRRFGLTANDHKDVALFCRCISDAIKRRGIGATNPSRHVEHVIADAKREYEGLETAFNLSEGIRLPAPPCVEMFDQYGPSETFVTFLKEAVELGHDINETAEGRFPTESTVAHLILLFSDVETLQALEQIGLDLSAADAISSLTEAAIRRMRNTDGTEEGLKSLKHLISEHGFQVQQAACGLLHDKIIGLKRDADLHGTAETRIKIIKEAIEFISARFPELRRKA
jgi:hypothetical protein